jgi:large subunit ribosomal protein L13
MNTQFYIIDACEKLLGRLAVNIIEILHFFKFRLNYIKNIKIVVLNSSKLSFNSKKLNGKKYMTYSGYFGGEKYIKLRDVYLKNSSKVIYLSLKRMLPKNKFFANYLKKNVKFYLKSSFFNKNLHGEIVYCN